MLGFTTAIIAAENFRKIRLCSSASDENLVFPKTYTFNCAADRKRYIPSKWSLPPGRGGIRNYQDEYEQIKFIKH